MAFFSSQRSIGGIFVVCFTYFVCCFGFQGHDTTSASICWTLFLLGSSPTIQDRVVAELDDIFDGDRQRPATMKDLNSMKYLECAIKESLRLYPSVPFLGRHLHEDVQIGNLLIQ